MNKQNIIKQIALIVCVLFLLFIYIYIDQTIIQESLVDYGQKNIEYRAPIAYEQIRKHIKYPEEDENNRLIDIYKNSMNNIDISFEFNWKNEEDNDFNSNIFRKFDKYYSDKKIDNDLKYFNNSTNLMLYHYNNRTDDDKIFYNNHTDDKKELY